MNIQNAYNAWSETYDAVQNKTRDMEAVAIRQLLADIPFAEIIEIGCGTGKNTEWLAAQATRVTAVDFSVEMLEKAKAKITKPNVRFQQADITAPWDFVTTPADLISCSLILEHIRDLSSVFQQAHRSLKPGGVFYIGELHPFKQYLGTKARFDTGSNGVFELECHTHHVSEYMAVAREHGFRCEQLREFFDDNNRDAVPRILALLLRKET